MDALLRDLKHAVRSLGRRPAFTAVAVVSLALGIGANSAIFTIVNAFLLRDLPLERPEELVEIYTSDGTLAEATTSYPDYLDIAALDEVFSDVVAYNATFARIGQETGSDLIFGEVVTGNYFDVLGVQPALGRGFLPEEDATPGTHAVVVLGHGYWQRQFGGSPDALGATLRISGRPYTVVGVMPESYKGMMRGLEAHVWVPMMMADEVNWGPVSRLAERGTRNLFLKGRLQAGVTPEQASAAVGALAVGLQETYPETNEFKNMSAVPTLDVAIHPAVDGALVPVAAMLLVVVGLVLLIACANLASFLLARASDRKKEVAVRLALGAGRGRLVRKFLTETVVLAGLGGVGGALLATWAVDLLVSFQPPLPVPVSLDLALDAQVLVFTGGVSLLAGILFGLAPALQATKPDLAPTLKGEGGEGGRVRAWNLRNVLVVTQVAFSLVLLIGAGLFLRSLRESQNVDPGFGDRNAAVLWMDLPPQEYPAEPGRAYFAELVERTEALPGVGAVGLASHLPLGLAIQTGRVHVDGVPAPEGADAHDVDYTLVGADYFGAIGVPLVAGRDFAPSDTPDSSPVVVINQAFAERFWPGRDPVGLTVANGPADEEPATVIGVVADTKVRTLGEAPRPQFFQPFSQVYAESMQVVAQADADAAAVLPRMQAIALDIEPDAVVMEARTMEEHLTIMLFAPKMAALLLTVFGGLALVLATIGLFGVVSYTVARKTREVGIRISLGAGASSVVAMVMAGGMKLVAVGAVIGGLLAFASSMLVSSFLVGVDAGDPVVFVAVPMLFLGVATIATFLPARRASRVDPVEALRSE